MRPTPNTARVVGLVTTNPAEAAATGTERATTQTRINNEIPTVFLMRVTPFGKPRLASESSCTARANDLCRRDSSLFFGTSPDHTPFRKCNSLRNFSLIV